MTVIEHSVNVDIQIGDTQWIATEMDVHRSRYNETDTATMMAIPDPDENPDAVPVEGKEIIIRLGPRTSFIEDAGRSVNDNRGSLYRVFTGYVSNSFEMQRGLWEIDAVDFILDLKKVDIYYSNEEPVPVSSIIESVVDSVNSRKSQDIEPDLESVIDLTEPNNSQRFGYCNLPTVRGDGPRDIEIIRQYTGRKASNILNELAKASNSNWWIDTFNRLQFGPTETSIHKLDWVVDTSAGKQTPPYRSVRVVGDGISSSSGREAQNLISKDGTLSQGNIDDTLQSYGGYNSRILRNLGITREELALSTQELKQPIFTYKNKSIKTLEEANNIRDKVLDELQEQQAGGKATIVGRPMVDVLDVIEMPDRFGYTSTGDTVPPAQYLVESVTHRAGSSGYETIIECGGLAGRYSGPVFEYQNGEIILNTDDPDFDVE